MSGHRGKAMRNLAGWLAALGMLTALGLLAAPYAATAETGADVADRWGGYVFDALILRPAAVVQLAVGAVAFPVPWVMSLGTGQSPDILDRCVAIPFDDAFVRPMGDF